MSGSNKKTGLVAIFSYLDDVCKAMDTIEKDSDYKDYEVYSHTSYHELMERAEKKWGPSEVSWFTLVGALTGVVCGFGMCLLCDWDWPIVVGGKAPGIYSLPAYVIFGFELMVLFGAIATIKGMLVMGRLPDPRGKIFSKALSDDKFAIFVPNKTKEGNPDIVSRLKGFGSEDVFDA